MTDQKWFSISEFAKLIGWHRSYVLSLVKQRHISTAQRAGPRTAFKIPRTELVKWGLIADGDKEVDLEI